MVKKISIYADFSHPVSMLVNLAQSCGAVGNLSYSAGRSRRILCGQEFKAGLTVFFDPTSENKYTNRPIQRLCHFQIGLQLIKQLGSLSPSAFLLLHNAENRNLGLSGTGECFTTELLISSWRITVLEWQSPMTWVPQSIRIYLASSILNNLIYQRSSFGFCSCNHYCV